MGDRSCESVLADAQMDGDFLTLAEITVAARLPTDLTADVIGSFACRGAQADESGRGDTVAVFQPQDLNEDGRRRDDPGGFLLELQGGSWKLACAGTEVLDHGFLLWVCRFSRVTAEC